MSAPKVRSRTWIDALFFILLFYVLLIAYFTDRPCSIRGTRAIINTIRTCIFTFKTDIGHFPFYQGKIDNSPITAPEVLLAGCSSTTIILLIQRILSLNILIIE